MKKAVLYHNPRCSKSREALALLENEDVDFEVVEYLKQPFTAASLQELLKKLQMKPTELVRKKEKEVTELDLDLTDQKAVTAAMIAHPVLVERPIFVKGDKAVVGRPPEKVLEIL